MRHISFVVLGCVFASSAFSSPVFQSPAFQAELYTPLLVAQSEATTLSDRDLRRIIFYANRSLEALINLGEFDDEQAMPALLKTIGRLIDAGNSSGLSQEDTAEFFLAYVVENGLDAVPGNWLTSSGGFDAQSLFQDAAIYRLEIQAVPVDIDAINTADLLAIQSLTRVQPETITVLPVVPSTQTEPQPVVEDQDPPSSTLALPEIFPQTDPEIRAILEWIKIVDSQWVIEVARGDSLGEYAAAVYNDRLQFRRIFQANRSVLRSPNVLPVGALLILPRVE